MDKLLIVLQKGASFAESGAGSKKVEHLWCSLTSLVAGFSRTCVRSKNISVHDLSTNSEVGMCSHPEICVKLNCIVRRFWWCVFIFVCLFVVFVFVLFKFVFY